MREPHVAVVSAGEQEPRLDVRLLQRHHRAVCLSARDIRRHTTSEPLGCIHAGAHLLGQIVRNGKHFFAALERLHDLVAAHVEHHGVVRREEEGRIPVEARALIRRVLLLQHAQCRNALVLILVCLHERIANHHRHGVFPLFVLILPARLGDAERLSSLEVAALNASTL